MFSVPPWGKYHPVVVPELIALGMAAKVIVIVENQNSSIRIRFSIVPGGCKPTEPSAYDNKVVAFAAIFRVVPANAIAEFVGNFIGSFMTSTHTVTNRG